MVAMNSAYQQSKINFSSTVEIINFSICRIKNMNSNVVVLTLIFRPQFMIGFKLGEIQWFFGFYGAPAGFDKGQFLVDR